MHIYQTNEPSDDANIIISGNNVYEKENQVNLFTEQFIKWVNANGLLINLKMTNYMLFSRGNVPNFLPVIMNNVNIGRVKTAKFLSFILDKKLSWTEHINALKSKMSRYKPSHL